ncbi:sulfurtransferase [Actinoplanes sp. TFC3]|uniref:sulfurtransferase n=1 Tax=Actinoplanes sp. TFC3 TaxID=1710355 RepID=UPI0008361377|nr:sulfurtransferase [Actinoplanes sp. TFC3]
MKPVVDLAWVQEHPDRVVLADVRWYLDGRSGWEAFLRGHLPGAVFVDLDEWLAAPASPAEGRHPLPDPAVFAEGLGKAGIKDENIIIAYDDSGGVVAARLVWMLRATGREAALLDGGLRTYRGKIETGPPTRTPEVFSVRPWPNDRLASPDEVAGRGSAVVLDARDAARYRGDTEPVDPRAGHIPGARNLPCRDNLDESGRFLPVAELRERFAGVGVRAGSDVISYCGSGVTACHNLLALEHAGLGTGRLYPGSWSQWSAADRPAATGEG